MKNSMYIMITIRQPETQYLQVRTQSSSDAWETCNKQRKKNVIMKNLIFDPQGLRLEEASEH